MPFVELYGMYVSKDQWDFVHHGAVACFFGLTMSTFICRRPIIGQYVTITKEYDFNVELKRVVEIKVHGLGKYD